VDVVGEARGWWWGTGNDILLWVLLFRDDSVLCISRRQGSFEDNESIEAFTVSVSYWRRSIDEYSMVREE